MLLARLAPINSRLFTNNSPGVDRNQFKILIIWRSLRNRTSHLFPCYEHHSIVFALVLHCTLGIQLLIEHLSCLLQFVLIKIDQLVGGVNSITFERA
jgi:hypothetical protein